MSETGHLVATALIALWAGGFMGFCASALMRAASDRDREDADIAALYSEAKKAILEHADRPV